MNQSDSEYELLPELEALLSKSLQFESSYKENNSGQHVIIPIFIRKNSFDLVDGNEIYYQSDGLFYHSGSKTQTYPQYPAGTLSPADIIHFQFSTGSIPRHVDLNFRPTNPAHYFMKVRVPLIPLPQDAITSLLSAAGIFKKEEQETLFRFAKKKYSLINSILKGLRGSMQRVVWGNFLIINVQNGTANVQLITPPNQVRVTFK